MPSLRTIKLMVFFMTLILFVLTGILLRELLRAGDFSVENQSQIQGDRHSGSVSGLTGTSPFVVPWGCGPDSENDKWVVDDLGGELVTTHSAGPYIAAVVRKNQNSGAVQSADFGDVEVYLISPCTGRIVGEIR